MKSSVAAAIAGAIALLMPAMADVPPDQVSVEARMDAVLGSHEGYREFFDALQKAAAATDKAALAAMLAYPFETEIDGERTRLTSEADTVGVFDRLFTAPVLKEIVDQKYEELFVNYQGVMIGGGSVWLGAGCANDDCSKSTPVKIIAINQPGG